MTLIFPYRPIFSTFKIRGMAGMHACMHRDDATRWTDHVASFSQVSCCLLVILERLLPIYGEASQPNVLGMK